MTKERKKIFLQLLSTALIYIIGVVGYTYCSNERDKSLIMNEIDSKLLIAAKSIKFMLKEDFHDRAISPTSISFDEEIKNRQKLNNYKEGNGFKWIYTIVESNGKFYFAAPTVSDEEARERKSWYFYPYEDIPEEFKKTFKEGGISFVEYSDQWGTFRSVAVAETSPGGRVYLACADYEITYIDQIMRQNLLYSIYSALFFIIISIPFIFLITRIYKNYNLKLKAFNEELIHHKENLEFLVQERTKQLQESNKKLEEELKIRTETEKILHLEKEKLENAMAEVKTLSGLLPICASCKKVRDDRGYWKQIEKYIQEHSDAVFSHGLCPDCAKKLYPDFYKDEQKVKK
ncbi:MAG TPA: hypothetical protein PK104_02395 [Spirochaetota bacterium]|nr:hypothetical protein [Spirochaetota bacterium]